MKKTLIIIKRILQITLPVIFFSSCFLLNLVRERIPEPALTPQGVRFQFYAPYAYSVFIAGDFNNWGDNSNGVVSDPRWQLLDPDGDGIWEITLRISPGHHKYKFVINGTEWIKDPNAKEDENRDNSLIIVR